MKKPLIIGVVAAAVTILAFIILINLPTPPCKPGEETFRREIVLYIDATTSMEADGVSRFNDLKEKIRDRLFNKLGLGDRVLCYRIDSKFDQKDNVIFDGSHLPKIPIHFTKDNIDCISEEWKEQVQDGNKKYDSVKKSWWEQIEEIQLSNQYSDYYGAFRFAGENLFTSEKDNREKWIIVFGDLLNDPTRDKVPGIANREERKFFSAVNILLVYPYGVHEANNVSVDNIKEHWREYFAMRGAKNNLQIIEVNQFSENFDENGVSSLVNLTEDIN